MFKFLDPVIAFLDNLVKDVFPGFKTKILGLSIVVVGNVGVALGVWEAGTLEGIVQGLVNFITNAETWVGGLVVYLRGISQRNNQ